MATHGAKETRSYQSGTAAYSTKRKTVLKRARKRARRGGERGLTLLIEQDLPALGIKPLDEWDVYELAHGKPRDEDGGFRKGVMPSWFAPVLQAEIEKRFQAAAGQKMKVVGLEGMVMARKLMRRASSENVRLEASKFFMEQVFGKAVQRVNLEGQLKIEALLGAALVNPDGGAAYGFQKVLDEAGETEDILDVEEA
jgi:hypothetical protein